ncbi:hypothetical protein DL96DRAFT_1704833 [Flagelloscypha sp. PMI_526]|nr:hypothetical protein DL96DRAFT_1704833 [Flagelloscypha sp. PMI_526]
MSAEAVADDGFPVLPEDMGARHESDLSASDQIVDEQVPGQNGEVGISAQPPQPSTNTSLPPAPHLPSPPASIPTASSLSGSSSTICWSNLEPWMDHQYVSQVCTILGWHPISVRVPRIAPDRTGSSGANNDGYCYLTFPSPVHAKQVLDKIRSLKGMTMPNSSKPFEVDFVSDLVLEQTAPPTGPAPPSAGQLAKRGPFSIFVGDLAPEVSNSDLLAVFRNPVLGLRNDRTPKFVQPFSSVVSSYILTDPVTHVSKGYGFVRFLDEKDQTRALIEMNGLYCLTRPMRISPANDTITTRLANASRALPTSVTGPASFHFPPPPPPPTAPLSVSALIAAGATPALAPAPDPTPEPTVTPTTPPPVAGRDAVQEFLQILTQLAGQTSGSGPSLSGQTLAPLAHQLVQTPNLAEAARAQQAQAHATMNSAINPSAYQHASFQPQSDPYNTTIFAGGLSNAITDETLKSLFGPFGDIHYVKVLVGKGCGFVQFLRKPDAQKAMDTMQGFPIGDGKRLRLSWGTGPYKAAQAATATQAVAEMQQQPLPPVSPPPPQPQLQPPYLPRPAQGSQISPPRPQSLAGLTHEQAIALLAQYGYFDQPKPQHQQPQTQPQAQPNIHSRSLNSPVPPFSSNVYTGPFSSPTNHNYKTPSNANTFPPPAFYQSSSITPSNRGFSPYSTHDTSHGFAPDKNGTLPYPLTGPSSPISNSSAGLPPLRYPGPAVGYPSLGGAGTSPSNDGSLIMAERRTTTPPYTNTFAPPMGPLNSSPTKPPRFTPEANSGVISRPTSMNMEGWDVSSLSLRPTSLGSSSPPRQVNSSNSEDVGTIGGLMANMKLDGNANPGV